MTTLAEALATGRGNERPFRCTEHDDSHASASVNVSKGVWFCFVCHAKGNVDVKKAPNVAELAQMMEPEKNCRLYPEGYLDLFTYEADKGYWGSRFPDWVLWAGQFGVDPTSGEATFPVRTPSGQLAGVGRRQTNAMVEAAKAAGENPSRYKYPRRWSASRSVHREGCPDGDVLVLVEGAADAASLWEVGVPAYGVYGSALHHPQREFVLRAHPQVIVLGQDMDDAGHRGAALSMGALGDVTQDVIRLSWPKNDPAECSPAQRRQALVSVLGDRYLPQWDEAVAKMRAAYQDYRDELIA